MRHLFTDRWGNPIFESFTQQRLRRLFHRPGSTPLLFAVKNRNWDEVIRRCKSHPQELKLRDETTGNTPLHVACRLDPPAAVIRAMKSAARTPNNEGATPLFYAASHRMTKETLQALLQVARQIPAADGSGKDPTADLSNHGRSPVHHACASFRGLDLEAFKLLFEETLRMGQVEVDAADSPHFIDEEFIDDLGKEYFDQESGKKTVNVLEMKDLTGQTPLGLLFRRYRERVRHVISRVDRLHKKHNPERAALAAALTVHGDLGGLWEKARWIVARLSEERRRLNGSDIPETLDPQSPGELAVAHEAATWAMEQFGDRPSMVLESVSRRSLPPLRSLSSLDESAAVTSSSSDTEEVESDSSASFSRRTSKPRRRKFRIVHSSVGLVGYGCPPEMIRLAISIHPSQVKEMDEDGNLPIHIATTATSNVVEAHPSEASMVHALAAAAADGADDLSVLSDAALSFFSTATVCRTTNPFDKVLKMLLQHYPEGARIPQGKSGRLPLVMAIESGARTWEDGIRTLLNAYPPAMHKKRLIEQKLYPNLLGLVLGPTPVLDGVPRLIGVKRSSTARRSGLNAKSTLFDLLRTKPDWLTKESEDTQASP
uniref:Uncharacterized protein n=1 Tax=Amphora coffeiformis TaxID=265554 RepID=A0A7S3P805_9STRA|mmetsp:Transcript_11181/g.21396  ORF Transcript_11181/g.21396 Transcript_11181/m.21396 type:complete len:601 (+) Transcript_11181:274-2076(+)|eukprot:scaffold8374_cov175-Amphora_coffeaeformis.AAC.61